MVSENKIDPGAHYRFNYRAKLSESDIKNGYIDIQLDPARVAKAWDMKSFMLMTVLKKLARAGKSHNSYEEDLVDCQDALRRELEIIKEDKVKVRFDNIKDVMKWGQ
jgi:hypothetical protein